MRTLSRFSIELPAASKTMVRFVSAFESCPRQYGLKLGGSCPSQPDQKCRQYSLQYQQRHGTIVRSSIITLWWINSVSHGLIPIWKVLKIQSLLSSNVDFFQILMVLLNSCGRSIVTGKVFKMVVVVCYLAFYTLCLFLRSETLFNLKFPQIVLQCPTPGPELSWFQFTNEASSDHYANFGIASRWASAIM